jgi:hypothetical protein
MATRTLKLLDDTADATLSIYTQSEGIDGTPQFSASASPTNGVLSWDVVDLAAGTYLAVVTDDNDNDAKVLQLTSYVHVDAAETVWLEEQDRATVNTAAIKAKTDNLPADPAATSDIPTAEEIADAVLEEDITDHSGIPDSTAEALANIMSVTDPLASAVPGAYAAGTAGYLIGTNLDAKVSEAGGGGSVVGDGPYLHTHTVYKPGGLLPAVGATVWVTQDPAGDNTIFGPVITDENGEVTLNFNSAGTYYVWVNDEGELNFPNPTEITVS